jgi:regulatory protein
MKPCLDYALHYISRFPKTEFELRLQLRKKWYYEKDIDLALEDLKKLNYVNDTEYVRLYLGSECERKGKPLLKVRGKLLQKGAEKDLIDEMISQSAEDIKAGQKTKILKEIDTMKNRGIDGIEIIQKLQGRGYEFSLIKEVIEER